MTDRQKSNPRFIKLYRRKLRRELDAMDYPGGKVPQSTGAGIIVDAGEKIRTRRRLAEKQEPLSPAAN